MTDLAGTTLLDRYFLRQSVGSGGMADVYLAWDKLRSAKMAVKILRRDLASTPRFFQMFAKEAELLRKLEHPSIVRLYEFDKEGDLVFIVMDWIEGTNLRQAIADQRKPFTLEEAAYILQPVCTALSYAHQNGVFHCDVKPANILIHVDGRVFLTDFGVARLVSEKVGGGTPVYMAPEQFNGDSVTAQSDIYALGVTLYEMLSGGEVPFRGDSPSSQKSTPRDRIAWEHVNLPLPPIRDYNPKIPPAVELVLASALHKDPSQRYASTMDLREAFEHARMESGREGSSANTFVQLFSNLTTVPSPRPSEPAAPPAPEPPRQPPRPAAPPQAKPPAGPVQRPIKPAQPGKPSAPKQIKIGGRTIQLPKINITITPDSSSPAGPQPGAPASRTPYLFGRSGDWAGRSIPIQQNLTMGRSSQSQLRLSEASVSRLHATIILTRKGVYVRDEKSSAGTFVNGKRIAGPVLLKHGDVVQIGYYQVFEFRER